MLMVLNQLIPKLLTFVCTLALALSLIRSLDSLSFASSQFHSPVQVGFSRQQFQISCFLYEPAVRPHANHSTLWESDFFPVLLRYNWYVTWYYYFLKILFVYSRERERGRNTRQREKQAPCREPDVGLDPGSPGSHPRPQAALNRCATGAALSMEFEEDWRAHSMIYKTSRIKLKITRHMKIWRILPCMGMQNLIIVRIFNMCRYNI